MQHIRLIFIDNTDLIAKHDAKKVQVHASVLNAYHVRITSAANCLNLGFGQTLPSLVQIDVTCINNAQWHQGLKGWTG